MTDPHQKAEQLVALADVHEQGRRDPSSALDALLQSIGEDAIRLLLIAEFLQPLQHLFATVAHSADLLLRLFDRKQRSLEHPYVEVG